MAEKKGLFGWLKRLFSRRKTDQPEPEEAPVPEQEPQMEENAVSEAVQQPEENAISEAVQQPKENAVSEEAPQPEEEAVQSVKNPSSEESDQDDLLNLSAENDMMIKEMRIESPYLIQEEVTSMKEQQFPVFVNREISWTRFNERVLEEAENKANPLCERLTFASIYQTNMDEFFMVRVGSLIDQMEADPMDTDGKTNLTPKQQLDAIFERVAELIPRRDAVYEELMSEVEKYGIRLVNFQIISKKESEHLEDYFMKNMLALMEPNVVGKKQMFPFLKSNSIYAVAVLETKTGKERIGIIPCDTGVFPRLVEVSEGTYILSEDLILHYLPKVFEGYKIKAKSLIRITRNADIDPDALYDMDLDWREFMEEIIKKRRKLAPVRLELSRQLEEKIVDVLCAYLDIDREQVFYYHEPLDLSFVFQLQDKLRSYTNLFYPRRIPQKSPALDTKRSILAQVKEEDKLLFYPYNAITPFLQMLDEAAADEDVISIRMTLYRVARQSKVIEALVEAAENGKEVLVLVELKARFDEENNIGWSRRLEAAGCRVIYGLPGYKVHSKLCLITRREETGNVYYTQIGTGNYNEKTARLYTDLSLLTANQEIGQDAMKVFQALIRGETVESSKTLLVAPKCLQNRIVEMIEEQIEIQKKGGEGYIGIKVNSVTDKLLMDKLIEASQAGVKVDMVVRGICCLVPGVPGVTDNIRVVSVVGRFLEHARIYIFGKPGADGCQDKIYIASADFMTRNTLKRVEVAAPILSLALKKRLRTFFELMLSDNQQAREMANDGTYYRIHNDKPALNSQEFFYDQAYREAEQGEEHEGGISVDEAVASAAIKEAEKAQIAAKSGQSTASQATAAISEAGRSDHISLSHSSGNSRS